MAAKFVAHPPSDEVLVAGASGLVGRALLAQLLARPGVLVHALLRRDVTGLPSTPRLLHHTIDFAHPGELPAASTLHIALGTTIKVAGSQGAFRAVDLDAVVNVARAARQAGVTHLAVVSALGADPQSGVFYNRIKGEMEAALRHLGFTRLVIARPSLLAGDRSATGQPSRPGERIALALAAPISWLLPASLRPIDAAVVARAMLRALHDEAAPAVQVLESAQLQRLGAARHEAHRRVPPPS